MIKGEIELTISGLLTRLGITGDGIGDRVAEAVVGVSAGDLENLFVDLLDESHGGGDGVDDGGGGGSSPRYSQRMLF